jgi:hypothetical protein
MGFREELNPSYGISAARVVIDVHQVLRGATN